MPMILNTNLMSREIAMNLGRVETHLNRSIGRLSSGKQIYTAADNAAGISISEGVKVRSRSLNRAIQNTNEGITLAQTADNALREITSILGNMRQLAIHSSSDHLSEGDREIVQAQYAAYFSEISRIASTTDQNGIRILDTAQEYSIQVGADTTADSSITISGSQATSEFLELIENLVPPPQFTPAYAATKAIRKLDAAINTINTQRTHYGSVINRLSAAANTLMTSRISLERSQANLDSLDMAQESTEFTRLKILQETGSSILAQANMSPREVLVLF